MDISSNVIDLSKNELDAVYTSPQNQEAIINERKQAYETIMTARKKELLQVVLRQTDYTESDAEKLLIELNYDVMKVLNNYHEVSLDKPTNHPKTTNQQIYSEIRNLMDTGAKKFRVDQENAKIRQEYIEKQKRLAIEKSNESKTILLRCVNKNYRWLYR